MNFVYPICIKSEVWRKDLDRKYVKSKISRIKGRINAMNRYFNVDRDNTFILLFKPDYSTTFEALEDLKTIAEIQAEFSRYIILPRSPVTVYEVWRAVKFDPAEYVWVRDSFAPTCENCIHVNLAGRCVSRYRSRDRGRDRGGSQQQFGGGSGSEDGLTECPDFFKHTAVDVVYDISLRLEAMLRNAILYGTGPAGFMFRRSASLLDREVFELGEILRELIPRYEVDFGYAGVDG